MPPQVAWPLPPCAPWQLVAITFQAERLIGRLNAIEATQIKYAGTQAMRKLGFEMQRELGLYMQQTFNDPVPFTIKSGRRRETGGLSVGISIEQDGDQKGQSPASYLFPLTKEGGTEVAQTRFNKGLRKIGAMSNSDMAMYWKPAPGTERRRSSTDPNLLKMILKSLNQGGSVQGSSSRFASGGVRYFINPDERNMAKKAGHLTPGIYRVKSNQAPQRLMSIVPVASVKPTKNFDFAAIVEERSAALLPGILRSELDRAMR